VPSLSPWSRPAAVLLAIVVLAITLAPNARANEQTPEPSGSAVFQYTELVPTASGPKAPGIGDSTTTPLSEEASSRLGITSDETERMLAELATSSAYGAPSGSATSEPGGAPQDMGSSLDESVGYTAEGAMGVGGERLIGLLFVMLASVVAAAALAIARRRV
jgi:hypothetical protein